MSGSRWFDKSLVLRDGVRLVSRIWLPNSNGPWPALLMRQPYGREIASTITYSHPEWWASKGYKELKNKNKKNKKGFIITIFF